MKDHEKVFNKEDVPFDERPLKGSAVSHMVYNSCAELNQPGLVKAKKGDAAIQSGNSVEAIARCTKAIAIDNSHSNTIAIDGSNQENSEAYLERGEDAKAEEDAEQVISINQNKITKDTSGRELLCLH